MRRIITGLGFGAVLLLHACAGAQTKPVMDSANKVRAIRVKDYKDRTIIIVEGSSRPTYTVFKLSEPHRIVVDLANTKVQPTNKKLARSPKAMVKSVSTRQFGKGSAAVGRVELTLPRHANYVSAVRGNRLIIEIPKYKKVVRKVKTAKGTYLTQQAEVQPPVEEISEADLAPPSEAPPASSEEAVIEQTAEEPVASEDAPAEAAPAEAAPAEAAPAEAAPAEAAPAEAAPAEAAPAEAAPAEAAPAEAAPAEAAPAEAAPAEAAPAEAAPAEAAPAEAAPAEAAPAEAAPAEAAPAEAAPVEAAPAEAAPAEAAPVESAPAEAAPVEAAPAEAAPAEPAPAEPAPLAEPAPADQSEPALPADNASEEAVQTAPVQEAPPEAAPEPVPFEEAPLAPEAPASVEPAPAPAEPIATTPDEDEGAELARKALEPEAAPAEEGGFVEEVPQAAAEEPATAPAPVETVPAVVAAAPEPEQKAAKILNIEVEPSEGGITTVRVEADADIGDFNAFKLEKPTRLVIDIWKVGNLFAAKEVAINASGFRVVRVGQYSDKVRLVLDSTKSELPKYNVTKEGNTLTVQLGEAVVAQEPKVIVEEAPQEVAEAPVKATPKKAPESDEDNEERNVTTIRKEAASPIIARSSLGEDKSRKRYKGRRISLDFQNADLRDIIRLIAEVSSLNIITADDVRGTLTIRLINVPWDQALDVILDSQALGMVRTGNVVRIAPKDRLATEEKQRLQSLKDSVSLEPLYVKIVPVNYADAAELAARVQPILSERGSVSVDARTNVLIIKDTPRNIDDATVLVENLDTQTPQVLIEAKIVEANTNFARDLGVQWGGDYQSGPAFGNGTGLTFPNTVGVTGGNSGPAANPTTPNFAVNLPAAAGPGAGGAVSFLFGSLTNSLVLDLRLSALESAGQGRVISSPRITTMNNRLASIQQGISIPFETTSAQGTQTQFIDAVIKLTVTPHITADRSVIMKIKAEKNAPETALRSAGGAPSISKKEATTEVLVKDGETTVIGGIFQISKSENTQGVPFFSKIPIIGFFFQKNTTEDQRSELLIFITPRIVTKKPTIKAAD